MMKIKSVALSLGLTVAFGLASQAIAAPLFNGSFETGALGPWNGIGNAYAITGDIAPTDGTYQALLDTGGVPAGGSVDPSPPGGTLFDILTFFGVSGGLSGYVEGSGISQDITVAAGDVLSFDFNFLSGEVTKSPNANDAAFLFADGMFIKLADVLGSSFGAPDSDGVAGTGYLSGSYVFQNSGPQTVGFVVMDYNDIYVKSDLLIDNVRTTSMVSEPASLAVLGLGVVIVSLAVRRRKTHGTCQ